MLYDLFQEHADHEFNASFDDDRERYAATAADADHAALADEAYDHPYIADPAAALSFVLGGNATFTLVSTRTGARYTYRVRAAKDRPSMFFASTLIGSDNESDYAYLGFFNTMHGGSVLTCRDGAYLRAGKKGNPDDVRFRALNWLLKALARRTMPSTVEFWHEGRCARCARLLTDPESIARGFGPECAKHA
jgi:hypothetical protein